MVERLQSIGRHFPAATKPNQPVRVAVTGAAGAIGAFLCNFVA